MVNSSWVIYSIADLIDQGSLKIGDGYRAKNEELGITGLPFIRAANIKNGIQLDEVDHLNQESISLANEKVSLPGDVVFTSKGTVGRLAFVQDSTPRFVYSPQLCYWRVIDPQIIDPRFLYYWMHGEEFRTQCSEFKNRSKIMDYISLSDQRRMHITLPPLQEQHAIASILGPLDDKIELNRSMNETLDAMIQGIFKSWFLNFDLVRANVENRPPAGVDAETAALFPNEFEESLLDKIPRGWKVAPIGDVVRIISGSTPNTQDSAYWEGGTIHWATPKDLNSLPSSVLLDTKRYITELGLNQISSGLLPEGTVLLSSRAPIGYFAITEIPIAINQGLIALVCDGELPNHYILQWLRTNMSIIERYAHGTTFLEISTANFRLIPIAIPPRAIVERFVRVAIVIHQQIVNNLEQSRILSALRDELLPGLLSRNVRVV